MPLASIQKVLSLTPIPGADAIECAHVLGWDCVVKKGEFKVGDLGVYIEIDSIVPDVPQFEFLRSKHFRVKTIRLRGQLSQGLFMPRAETAQSLPEGFDVTDLLMVKKYEKEIPAELRGTVKGTRPSFIPKTDEERIQSCKHVLDEIRDLPVYITTKCDGSSMTAYYKLGEPMSEGEFGVCSRNMELKEDENNAFWKVAKALNLPEKMKAFGKSIAIQGELCGPGIQKNPMGLSEPTLYGFNVVYLDGSGYADFSQMAQIFDELGVTPAPLLTSNVKLSDYLHSEPTTENVVAAADGKYANGSPREGIVIRPMNETYSPTLKGRMSFKAVSNVYLEKVEK